MNIIWKKINSNAGMFSISDTVKPKLTKSKLMEERLGSGVKKINLRSIVRKRGCVVVRILRIQRVFVI